MKDEKAVNREGDVILIHYQDQPVAYARIEGINPDIKKDWYQMTLLLLTIPAQSVTWILRDEYINGASFTMGGQSMRLEKVKRVFPGETRQDNGQPQGPKSPEKASKVIAFKKQH
ncbi:MAG: hypothetical protein H6Q48_3381 [Deltaproteobacteria bacterium]|jgi:hypothetical protein|nr:hypothetical protein [Deltaproteobacteria bacterium]